MGLPKPAQRQLSYRRWSYIIFVSVTPALVTIALIFVDGLLIGVAAKKGFVAMVLLLIAVVLSAFLGIAYLKSLSASTIEAWIVSHTSLLTQSIEGLLPIGSIGSISLSLVLFVVGIVVGFWKG